MADKALLVDTSHVRTLLVTKQESSLDVLLRIGQQLVIADEVLLELSRNPARDEVRIFEAWYNRNRSKFIEIDQKYDVLPGNDAGERALLDWARNNSDKYDIRLLTDDAKLLNGIGDATLRSAIDEITGDGRVVYNVEELFASHGLKFPPYQGTGEFLAELGANGQIDKETWAKVTEGIRSSERWNSSLGAEIKDGNIKFLQKQYATVEDIASFRVATEAVESLKILQHGEFGSTLDAAKKVVGKLPYADLINFSLAKIEADQRYAEGNTKEGNKTWVEWGFETAGDLVSAGVVGGIGVAAAFGFVTTAPITILGTVLTVAGAVVVGEGSKQLGGIFYEKNSGFFDRLLGGEEQAAVREGETYEQATERYFSTTLDERSEAELFGSGGLYAANGPTFGADGLLGANGGLFGRDGIFGPNGPADYEFDQTEIHALIGADGALFGEQGLLGPNSPLQTHLIDIGDGILVSPADGVFSPEGPVWGAGGFMNPEGQIFGAGGILDSLGRPTADTINSLDGDAVSFEPIISGAAGADTIVAGAGNEIISGGEGNDIIYGAATTQLYYGGGGNDSINGRSTSETIFTGSGNDTVRAGGGEDRIVVGDGTNEIDGGEGYDLVFFEGVRADYTFSTNELGEFVVTNARGEETTVRNSEALVFRDGHYHLGNVAYWLPNTIRVESQDFIVNGSFENVSGLNLAHWGIGEGFEGPNLVGWTEQNGLNFEVVHASHDASSPSHGEFYLDTDETFGNSSAPSINMNFYQQVSGLEESQLYLLTMEVADRQPDLSNSLEVYWGGELIGVLDPGWATPEPVAFWVSGGQGDGSNILRFIEVGSPDRYGMALDNVRMFEANSENIDQLPFGGGGALNVADIPSVEDDTDILRELGKLGLEVYSPDLSSPATAQPVEAFETGGEFQFARPTGFGVVPVDVSLAGETLLFEYASSGQFGSAPDGFNGYRVFDAGLALEDIIDVEIDELATTLGLEEDDVTFDANNIFVNVEGLPYDASSQIVLNLVHEDTTPVV